MERSADQRLRTTEWEDIQYKFGNRVGKYATHELELLAQRLSDTHQDACLQSYDAEREAHEAKVARGGYDCLSEDDKGDDARHAQTLTAPPSSSTNAAGGKPLPTNDSSEEDEDDDALMAIRRRRLAELQKQKQLNQFGVLRHIPGSAYVDEVTHASRMNWVVAVLMEPGQSQSEALLQVLRTVAQRQPAVKFVSMIATEAIANFPSRHVPCVLLYHKENLVQRMMGLEDWQPQGAKGGLTVSGVELILRRCGVLPRDEDEEDPSTDASR